MSETCAAHEMLINELVHLRDNQGELYQRTNSLALDMATNQGDLRLVAEIVSRVELKIEQQNKEIDTKLAEILIQVQKRLVAAPRSSKKWISALVAASLGSGGLGSILPSVFEALTRHKGP